MAFCINCGHELIEGAKFCANCGIATNNIEASTKRKMVYDGEIHKCPNCGETLKSFQGNCPSCGYELRGIKSSSSVKELTEKLEQIEKNRKVKKRFSFKNNFKLEIDEIDEQKISLIRSFTIPNTKEDLYEFLFLSYSNIDFDSYDDGNQAMLFSRRAISDAWKASFEQAYQKSKIIFANDSDKLHEIQQLYDSSKKSIKKAKLHSWKSLGIVWGVLIGVFALIFIIIGIYSPISEKKEVERLEAIVAEIEVQLEKGEYKYALMNADSLVYSGSVSNDEQERQWVVKREYWMDKVIEEANKNGVYLEKPTNKPTEPSNEVTLTEPNDEITSTEVESVISDTVNIKRFIFEIPDYWIEEESANETRQYYAENGEAFATLSISYPKETDENYDVSFDGLYADNDNMIDSFGIKFNDGEVIDYRIYESSYGVKGILYQFTYNHKIDWFTEIDGEGYCFCFPSKDDRRWFYITFQQTYNADKHNYKEDFMKLLSNIQEK